MRGRFCPGLFRFSFTDVQFPQKITKIHFKWQVQDPATGTLIQLGTDNHDNVSKSAVTGRGAQKDGNISYRPGPRIRQKQCSSVRDRPIQNAAGPSVQLHPFVHPALSDFPRRSQGV